MPRKGSPPSSKSARQSSVDGDDHRDQSPALLRLRNYTADALKVEGTGPPWHRGCVAIAGVLGALAIGQMFDLREALAIAPALAVFMTLADVEGPLRLRLATLALASSGMTVGALAGLVLASDPLALGAVFIGLAAIAAVASSIGPPYQPAGRFTLVVALFMSLVHGADAKRLVELALAVSAWVALLRLIENVIAPDARIGEFKSLKEALFTLRAGRWHLYRFVLAYVFAAGLGYALGRMIDAVHPSWVTASVVVVMWSDAHRSYLRVVQRIIGTLAGALITLVMTSLVSDARIIAAIAVVLLYFVPHFIKRNYWLHSGLMLVLVMLSLDIWSGSQFSSHVLLQRICDVLLGCALALLGTVLAFAGVQERLREAASADAKAAQPT